MVKLKHRAFVKFKVTAILIYRQNGFKNMFLHIAGLYNATSKVCFSRFSRTKNVLPNVNKSKCKILCELSFSFDDKLRFCMILSTYLLLPYVYHTSSGLWL